MAKRKRTREQKKLADHRRSHPPKVENSAVSDEQIEANSTPKYTFTLQKASTSQPQIKTAAANPSYAYMHTDLRKTAILTASIVFAQILLYFVINTL